MNEHQINREWVSEYTLREDLSRTIAALKSAETNIRHMHDEITDQKGVIEALTEELDRVNRIKDHYKDRLGQADLLVAAVITIMNAAPDGMAGILEVYSKLETLMYTTFPTMSTQRERRL